MLQARVIASYPWNTFQSAGLEFVKREWRRVPVDVASEICRNTALEFLTEEAAPLVSDPTPEPTPAQDIQPDPPARRRRKGAA